MKLSGVARRKHFRKSYTRRIRTNGAIRFDQYSYYVREHLAGQLVDVKIDGRQRQLVISHNGQVLKQLPIKGLVGHPLPFDAFVERLVADAQRHDRLQHHTRVRSDGTVGC